MTRIWGDKVGLWDKVKEGTKTISERSGELVEAAKIRAAIARAESEVLKKETELGRLIYKWYEEQGVGGPEEAKICEEIKALKEEIAELKERLTGDVPEGMYCKKCSAKLEEDANYCSKCGYRVVK
ncbi:MAG: zinc ribbon domain-containing protein [Peptococcaceae bacterium]|nr:zinc ribbon domain-containing protein [Peptococcaceae bacterium]